MNAPQKSEYGSTKPKPLSFNGNLMLVTFQLQFLIIAVIIIIEVVLHKTHRKVHFYIFKSIKGLAVSFAFPGNILECIPDYYHIEDTFDISIKDLRESSKTTDSFFMGLQFPAKEDVFSVKKGQPLREFFSMSRFLCHVIVRINFCFVSFCTSNRFSVTYRNIPY